MSDLLASGLLSARLAQTQNLSGGSFGGVNAPAFQTGKYYLSHWLSFDNKSLTLTANRLYRVWFHIDKTTTFLGSWCYNSGAGDNLVVIRMGVWNEAGVLQKDFGVITLSAAAALRTDANTVTLPGPGWYQIGMVSSGTPAMYTIDNMWYGNATIPGAVYSPLAGKLGSYSPAPGNDAMINMNIGDYAAFTYAAMPDPITTATVTKTGASSSTVGTFPAMGLYL